MKIGVLAVQGAFAEHQQMLKILGADSFQIRQKSDLENSFDGLIIPGGESTVQGKLLNDLGMLEPIEEKIRQGMPVFGTCAGLILLSDKIENDDSRYLGTMHITSRRNAYGRQLGSFYTEEEFKGIGKIPMTFIRAPYIVDCQDDVEILATVDGKAVAAKSGNQLVTAFHPELNEDLSVHQYFIDMVKNSK
ncbi:MAG: pyridoxal 5'-phosphate synthase glutaminase subunit PdxT [Ruminococcus sp.]